MDGCRIPTMTHRFYPLGPNTMPGLERVTQHTGTRVWSVCLCPCRGSPLRPGWPATWGVGQRVGVSSLFAAVCQVARVQLVASLARFHWFTLLPPAVAGNEIQTSSRPGAW